MIVEDRSDKLTDDTKTDGWRWLYLSDVDVNVHILPGRVRSPSLFVRAWRGKKEFINEYVQDELAAYTLLLREYKKGAFGCPYGKK